MKPAFVLRGLLCAALLDILHSTWPAPAQAATVAANQARQVTLHDMLAKGLKARRPEEFAYLEEIVALVEAGDLPESLVQATFFWARKKYRRPLQYFQQALSQRAAKLGIEVPSLKSNLTTAVVSSPGLR